MEFAAELLESLRTAQRVAALTGAGTSAESGVPTFRGKDGWWKNFRAEELATPQAFHNDPELVWRWYDQRRQELAKCRPNAAHRALARMERQLPQFTLLTQNVDGLHRLAGSKNVIALHGDIWTLRDVVTGETIVDHAAPLPEIPPKNPRTGNLWRPGVVWFGEMLDPVALAAAEGAASSAQIFFSIGTSALVQPAASLLTLAQYAGALTVEINLDPTPATSLVDLAYQGKAGEILPALCAAVWGPEPA